MAALAATLCVAFASHGPGATQAASIAAAPSINAGRDSTFAEWTLLIFAANDDRDPSLVDAFDQDATEWQRGLGGSARLQILVERDYAAFQQGPDGADGRPSERYALVHGQRTEVTQLGETDTTDEATLSRFLVYGIRRFPAKHYWVIVTGRGDGWNGLAFDATTGAGRRLTIAGLARALRAGTRVIDEDIRLRPGLGGPGTSRRIDVVQFDVCRLGTIEVAAALADAADTMLASQEVMPDAGHPYRALRCIERAGPGLGPRELVSAMVTDYVRAYSAADSGAGVTSVGLDLRRLSPLLAAVRRLREAVRQERPQGFACAEARALAEQAEAGARIGGRALDAAEQTPASASAVDLVALLETLADPARAAPAGALAPRVSPEVAGAARAALEVLGRPPGTRVRAGKSERALITFNRDGPFIVEAHQVEPGSAAQARGLSALWGDPLDLLLKEDGVSAFDVYLGQPYEALTGWTGLFEACVAEARACWSWTPDPARPDAPSPCEGVLVSE